MGNRIERRLKDLGITLPEPSIPPALYSPIHSASGIVTVAGQPPYWGREPLYFGKLGKDLNVTEGRESARVSALNILAHLRVACGGDLDRVTGCIRMFVLVHAVPDFYDVHVVADGASELFAQVFAPLAPPTRSSAGCISLPLNVATEVEASFTIRD